MTSFFFKQKPIELIAYTDNPVLAEFFPIVKGSQSMPNYYKTMPHKISKANVAPFENILNYKPTIRGCYGINQFNLSGFVIPLWSDYSIVSGKDGVSCAAPKSRWEIQDPLQSSNVLDDYYTVKFVSPWILRCKENVKFILLQNFFAHNSEDWVVPSGVVDFKHQSATHNFVLIKKQTETKEIIFNAGAPLTRLIPLSEREVTLKIELVDDLNNKRIIPGETFFLNSMSKLIKQKEKLKCPFNN